MRKATEAMFRSTNIQIFFSGGCHFIRGGIQTHPPVLDKTRDAGVADIADHAAGNDLPMAVGCACPDDGANGGSIDSFNTSSHGRYLQFHMAEVAIPRYLFTDILRLIAELRLPTTAAPA